MFRRSLKQLSLVTAIIVGCGSPSYAAPFLYRKLATDAIESSKYYLGVDNIYRYTNMVDYNKAYNQLRQIVESTDSNSPEGQASRELLPIFRDLALTGGAVGGMVGSVCYAIRSPEQQENCVQQIMNWLSQRSERRINY